MIIDSSLCNNFQFVPAHDLEWRQRPLLYQSPVMCTSLFEKTIVKELVQTVINHIILGKLFSTFLCFKINKWFELIFWLISLFCIYMFTLKKACYQLLKVGNTYVFLLDNIQRNQASCISHQILNKFFFWRPSGFAALSVDRDEVGSLKDKIRSRVSLFISIAKSELGPLASSTIELCTIILSNLE